MEDLSQQASDIQGSRCEELYAARYFKSISDRESRSDWHRQPILATLLSLPGRFLLAGVGAPEVDLISLGTQIYPRPMRPTLGQRADRTNGIVERMSGNATQDLAIGVGTI